MKKILLSNLLLLFAVLTLTVNAKAQSSDEIVIVSGVENGSYHTIAMDIKNLIESEKLRQKRRLDRYEEDLEAADESDSVEVQKITRQIDRTTDKLKVLDHLKLNVIPSRGSFENFEKLVKRTNTNIAFLQYDVILDRQLADIETDTYYTEDLRVFLPLGYEHVHLIVAKDSKINGIDDLKKKRVAVGTDKSGTAITARIIKEKTKTDWIDVPISLDNAFTSLIDGTIDALFFVGAAPVDKFERLPQLTKDKIRLIPVVHDGLKDVEESKKGPYKPVKISAETYKWANYETETYAVRAILAVNKLDETKRQRENNKELFQFIYDNIKTLQKNGHPVWQLVTFEYTDFERFDIDVYEPVQQILKAFDEEDLYDDEEEE